MKVFVYGTLLKGERNHGVLGDAKLIGKAVINGFHIHNVAGGGFPGVLNIGGRDKVHGEVYEVENFERLDRLEGYNEKTDSGMYLRRTTTGYYTTWEESNHEDTPPDWEQVWYYQWNGRVVPDSRIMSGDWRNR